MVQRNVRLFFPLRLHSLNVPGKTAASVLPSVATPVSTMAPGNDFPLPRNCSPSQLAGFFYRVDQVFRCLRFTPDVLPSGLPHDPSQDLQCPLLLQTFIGVLAWSSSDRTVIQRRCGAAPIWNPFFLHSIFFRLRSLSPIFELSRRRNRRRVLFPSLICASRAGDIFFGPSIIQHSVSVPSFGSPFLSFHGQCGRASSFSETCAAGYSLLFLQIRSSSSFPKRTPLLGMFLQF